MNDGQLLRYSRHILLEEIGVEGQQRILEAKVLIVGAGGLGSPAALYLAAAGVGRITLADGDTVDLTNLQRQILHTQERIGQPSPAPGRPHYVESIPRWWSKRSPPAWRRSTAGLGRRCGRGSRLLRQLCHPTRGQPGLRQAPYGTGFRCGDPLCRTARGIR
jgi:glycine/D-amino acid oxidase-like deaminating enzyme